MARWITAAMLSLVLAGCADLQPQPYRVEGKSKGVTQAEVDLIVATAQRYLYGYSLFSPRWPIYRVRFKSSREAEVWYGNPNSDQRNYLIFDSYSSSGWHCSGSGTELNPRLWPNQALQPTAGRSDV